MLLFDGLKWKSLDYISLKKCFPPLLIPKLTKKTILLGSAGQKLWTQINILFKHVIKSWKPIQMGNLKFQS